MKRSKRRPGISVSVRRHVPLIAGRRGRATGSSGRNRERRRRRSGSRRDREGRRTRARDAVGDRDRDARVRRGGELERRLAKPRRRDTCETTSYDRHRGALTALGLRRLNGLDGRWLWLQSGRHENDIGNPLHELPEHVLPVADDERDEVVEKVLRRPRRGLVRVWPPTARIPAWNARTLNVPTTAPTTGRAQCQ